MNATQSETFDGKLLDITVTVSTRQTAWVLVYPNIFGTTRLYSVPHEELAERGYTVVEYHPRAHGRSTGTMEMHHAIKDLYRFLAGQDFFRLPVFVVAHSAGCNAVLQLNRTLLKVQRYVFVQPVFDFKESMLYMYSAGTYGDFIAALSRFTPDPSRLERTLRSPSWLDPREWQDRGLREEINSFSVNGFELGTFLEDFYIPSHHTKPLFASIADRTTVLVTENDRWYPPSSIRTVASETGAVLEEVSSARDHFFTGGWPTVWERVGGLMALEELF
ncbi:MAG: alpha/beta fold hydrolase [Acidobacteriota bacterium]